VTHEEIDQVLAKKINKLSKINSDESYLILYVGREIDLLDVVAHNTLETFTNSLQTQQLLHLKVRQYLHCYLCG
jgi:isopentenyldiphosphate isomerase